MPFITSAADARRFRKPLEVHGNIYYLTPYVGSAPLRGKYVPGNEINDDGLPQGFLVEQPPSAITPPHFHDYEQFQVFIDGSAHIGKSEASPLSLHYAGGHTPYGPIAAGPDGIIYFTLRSRWDSGAKYMPGAKHKLKPVKREHRMVSEIKLLDEFELRDFNFSEPVEVIAPSESGICAYLFNIGAFQRIEMETPVKAGGQYAIIVAGSASNESRDLPRLSGLYRFRDEEPLNVNAGEKGVSVLLMQFSKDDPA